MTENIHQKAMKLSEFLAESEEDILMCFIDYVILENEYKTAGKFSGMKNIIHTFHDLGYSVDEEQLKDGYDGTMKWRMTLRRDGQEICHRDIEINIKTLMGYNG